MYDFDDFDTYFNQEDCQNDSGDESWDDLDEFVGHLDDTGKEVAKRPTFQI